MYKKSSRKGGRNWTPAIIVGSVVFILGLIFYWQFHLYSRISSVDVIRFSRKKYVDIVNQFDYPISIFYDDHESGAFLSTLRSKEKVSLEAYVGQVLYATHVDDWESIDSIEINRDQQSYVMGHDSSPGLRPASIAKDLSTPALAKLFSPAFGKSSSNTTSKLNFFPKLSKLLSNHEVDVVHKSKAKDHPGLDHSHHNLITHNAFTQEHLNESLVILHRLSQSVAAQFRNIYPRPVKMWFGSMGASLQGVMKTGAETTLNGYEGHNFFFSAEDEHGKDVQIAHFVLHKEQCLYVVRASTPEDLALVPSNLIKIDEMQTKFQEEYLNRTGILWRQYFDINGPRKPPVLYMWPAVTIGQVHTVESTEGHWICSGKASKCKEQGSLSLSLEVVSTHPKVFIIKDFLSDFECSEIINIAKPKIHKSTIGNGEETGGAHESDTRTSENAWINRKANEVTETLYRRAANVLKVDEKLLYSHLNAEEMQVVHYGLHQHYDAHHDWGVSGEAESRYITLLLYLTDMESEHSGGETSFPKAANGEGFKVRPVKGNAVLFYNLLEDGNGDDLSLHSSLPVSQGEKWLANFWVWDPKR